MGLDYTSEAKLIATFPGHVATRNCQLWGFNVRGSDLPILVQRGGVLGALCPKIAARSRDSDYFYHSGDSHVGSMDARLSGYGAASR